MKKKKIEELKDKTVEELRKRILELRKEIVELRLKIKAGQEKNVRKPKIKRKELAQALTALRASSRIPVSER